MNFNGNSQAIFACKYDLNLRLEYFELVLSIQNK